MRISPNGASEGNPNYGTAPEIVAAARAAMGGIDLDPCTTAAVNAWHIQAPTIYTANGLEQPWHGRVFCNPPGGRGNDAVDWWEHGLRELRDGRCTALFYVSFSLDRLQTSQRSVPLTAFPTFVPDARVAYLHHDDGVREVTRTRKGHKFVELVEYKAGEIDGQPPKPSCFTLASRDPMAHVALRRAFEAQGIKGIVLAGT